jgi:hypothetical protein
MYYQRLTIMKKLFLFIFIILFTGTISSKVLIFTYAYNRPEFIEWQYHTFKKFVQDDYEFVVFNDATTYILNKKIREKCTQFGLRCIQIPQDIHDNSAILHPEANGPSARNCNVVKYSLDNLGFYHDDIVVLVDSDLFLIKPFSFKEYLSGYQIGGRYRTCAELHDCMKDHPALPYIHTYLWIGLVFIDIPHLPNVHHLNFNSGRINGVFYDTGGGSATYLKNNPTVKVKDFEVYKLENLICTDCFSKIVMAFNHDTNCEHLVRGGCTHNNALLKKCNFSDTTIQFLEQYPIGKPLVSRIEFYLHDTFLHFREGSNYGNYPEHIYATKMNIIREYIISLTNP